MVYCKMKYTTLSLLQLNLKKSKMHKLEIIFKELIRRKSFLVLSYTYLGLHYFSDNYLIINY